MSTGNLSASCLCYLFGDRFIKPLTWYERLTGIAAVDIPSSGRLVALGRLEREMLAIGLWSLHDSGELALRYTKAIQPGRPLDFSQFRLELSADHTLG